MRLEADRDLSTSTIEAIEDIILPPPPEPLPDDETLQRFAFGIATATERSACARAILRNASARAQVARLRREAPGIIARNVHEAERVDRLIAEGRWIEGSDALYSALPAFCLAWRGARSLGRDEEVASFVASLSGPLMEIGANDELVSLAEEAFVAAERLGRPSLRARMLSMLAVLASRRGDSTEARRLWNERLEIAKGLEDWGTAADALLDLAGQAYEDGEEEECLRLAAEAEPIAQDARRPDLLANVWNYRALVALRSGDQDLAAEHAQLALKTLTGAEGLDVGMSVRLGAVRILSDCGWPWTALGEACLALSLSVEGGRASFGAVALGQIGSAFGMVGEPRVAERCLMLSLRTHKEVGTRFIQRAEARLEALRTSARLGSEEPILHPNWAVEAASILAEIAHIRERSNVSR